MTMKIVKLDLVGVEQWMNHEPPLGTMVILRVFLAKCQINVLKLRGKPILLSKILVE